MIRGPLGDAIAILSARPLRTLSQGAGVAIGAGLFVVALGLGQTIGAQVDDRFDVYAATTVVVAPDLTTASATTALDDFVTWDRVSATKEIAGVIAAGRVGVVENQNVTLSALPGLAPSAQTRADVILADPDTLPAIEASVEGYPIRAVDNVVPRRIALLGRGLADELGVQGLGGQIHVGGVTLTVVGIITDTRRDARFLRAVVLSPVIGKLALGAAHLAPSVIIRTTPGAAQVVATNLALQLSPERPTALTVSAPPSPQSLHDAISADVQRLAIAGATAVLLAGIFAVANLMLLTVLSRISELGMRRALGASRLDVIALVLTEAGLVGLLAGIVGSVLGVWVVLGVTLTQHWSPVLDLRVVWIGVLSGCLGGLMGGLVPAAVAAKVPPAQALRG